MNKQTKLFDLMEKNFLALLSQIYYNIFDSIIALKRDDDGLLKSQICEVFIGVDAFSRYNKILEGMDEKDLDKDNKERFTSWLNNFVLTEKNEVYREHKGELNIDAGKLWILRNSLVHYYGLPPVSKMGASFGLSGGDADVIHDRVRKFKELGNKAIILIHPTWLIKACLHGFLLQLDSMKRMIVDSPSIYVERIRKAHRIIIEEGGVMVSTDGKVAKYW